MKKRREKDKDKDLQGAETFGKKSQRVKFDRKELILK